MCTVSRTNLKGIMELLSEDEFIRIHRSYVVATGKVVMYTRRKVQMVNDTVLPVGRLYTDEVLRRIRNEQ